MAFGRCAWSADARPAELTAVAGIAARALVAPPEHEGTVLAGHPLATVARVPAVRSRRGAGARAWQTCPRCLLPFPLEGEKAEEINYHACPHGKACHAGAGRLEPGWIRAACPRCDRRHAYRRGEAGSAEARTLVLDFCGPEREAGGATFYRASAAHVVTSAEPEIDDEPEVDDVDDAREVAGYRRKGPRKAELRAAQAEGARAVLAALKGKRTEKG